MALRDKNYLGEVMNIKNAYLCPDCDEIFCIESHSPICPICSCKNAINLARILNRKEGPYIVKPDGPDEGKFGQMGSSCPTGIPGREEIEDDETYFAHNAVHGIGVPDNKLGVNDSPPFNPQSRTKPIANCSNQIGDRESRGEDISSSENGIKTNRDTRRVTSLTDALRILFQYTSSIKQILPRADADPMENSLS
jgi:hypothetical protein